MNGLAPEVHELIVQSIDSVESVEALLLLRRSPGTFWTATAAAQQLGAREDLLSAKLVALANAGLLATGQDTGAYRFAPKTDKQRAAVDALAAAYENHRVSVINTIYAENLERLRAFSNAFRFKK